MHAENLNVHSRVSGALPFSFFSNNKGAHGPVKGRMAQANISRRCHKGLPLRHRMLTTSKNVRGGTRDHGRKRRGSDSSLRLVTSPTWEWHLIMWLPMTSMQSASSLKSSFQSS